MILTEYDNEVRERELEVYSATTAALWQQSFEAAHACGRAEMLCEILDHEQRDVKLDKRMMATFGPLPF